MEILKFDAPEPEARTKKSSGKRGLPIGAMVAAGVVAYSLLGTTLAGNIAINAGSDIEFGQGYAATAACDADGVLISPAASFNASTNKFSINEIKISGIDYACNDKYFRITGYSDGTPPSGVTANSIQQFIASNNYVKIQLAANGGVKTPSSGMTVVFTAAASGATDGVATITFASPNADAVNVEKMTIESSVN